MSEPPAASSPGARCLSSEHAVIVKEQTAQAIANTARAYEKSGVEAALSEVRPMGSPGSGGPGPPQRCQLSHTALFCVSAALNHPFVFLLHSAATA